MHEKGQVIKNFATLGGNRSSTRGDGCRGKHFCKQLAKNVHAPKKNAIKVARMRRVCLSISYVGKKEEGVWHRKYVCVCCVALGVACRSRWQTRWLIVINATKTCVKYASCALLLRFMAHGD